MDRSRVLTFLRLIGCENIKSRGNDWVMASCPFSWLHSGGEDSSPSFGIKVNKDGPSGYNCFGCHESGGSLVTLLNELDRNSSSGFNEAFDFILEHGFDDTNFKDPASDWVSFKSGSIQDSNLNEQRESYFTIESDTDLMPDKAREDFESFEQDIHPYLLDRGFKESTCVDWGVRVESIYSGAERVVLPVYDYDSNLVAYTRRVVWNDPTCQVCFYSGPEMSWHGDFCPECDTDYDRWFVWPKYQHSKGFNRNYLLFGEHLINSDNKVGIVVEGNFDAMRLYEYGYENVVAVMGSKVGQSKPGHQMYRLGVHFDRIIILADGDEAGRDMMEDIQSFYQSYPDKLEVDGWVCPDDRDPGDMDRKKLEKVLDNYGVFT